MEPKKSANKANQPDVFAFASFHSSPTPRRLFAAPL